MRGRIAQPLVPSRDSIAVYAWDASGSSPDSAFVGVLGGELGIPYKNLLTTLRP
ncbi:MAG: hypothetical protein P8R42_07595 [Candidatus Binatia bacterium]|nr:hypothetical protein [Candidatus Binatia bacterium]